MGTASHSSTNEQRSAPRLTLAELERAVADVAPEAVLLPPRILRRVIHEEQHLPRLRLHVPNHTSYLIARTRLLEIVDPVELPTETAARLPEQVLLLPQPEAEELEATPASELLTRYWRWLFHGQAHRQLEQRRAEGRLEPAAVRRAIEALGMAAYAEARSVLIQEGRLLPEADETAVLIELVATWFGLVFFAPSLLPHYFPGLADEEPLRADLAGLFDAETLLEQTRLRGAKRRDDEKPPLDEDDTPSVFRRLLELRGLGHAPQPSPRYCQLLVSRAEAVAERRNWVRACILLQRARKYAAEKDLHRLRALARGHLVRLVGGLQEAIHFPDAEIDAWREALSALVTRAALGVRSREARLLFDLQKIAIDHERQVYRIDTWGWLRSLGRQPLRRPLPRLTEVLIHKYLVSALRRVRMVRIPDAHRQALQGLLKRAEERSELQLRHDLRPIVARAIQEAQLLPSNPVEEVAARKMVEELLDRILQRGFLAIGDLRDAVARNQLKCRDLTGFRELRQGDQLLSADRHMAQALDGVYRPGEVYMRAMQRLSSLAFGTEKGRLLMRFLILPFGGAYVIQTGVWHLVENLGLLYGKLTGAAPPPPPLPTPSHGHPLLRFELHTAIVLVLGVFLLLLINAAWFRRAVGRGLRAIGQGLHYLTTELPQRLMQLEVVRQLLHSRLYRWLVRGVLKPGVVTGLLVWFLPKVIRGWSTSALGVAVTFVGVNLLLNSRLGRDVEELLNDGMSRLSRWLGRGLARLFWLFLDFLRASVEASEQVLYTVDEWFRFRSGEGREALLTKAIFGTFWRMLAYLIRFCVNLLIEPQFNPIKHFPVVTVSHKVLLPFIPALAGVLMLAMDKELAYTLSATIIFCIPGIFGFLAWELRENWRLYGANRSPVLRPTVIGKHGESMRRLLLPGLHSGTIPKRFAKLRHAEQEAAETGRWSPVRKHLGVLEELHEEVRNFAERDLLWLLNSASCWQDARLFVGQVELTTNQVRIELRLDEPAGSLLLEFTAREGWLLGGICDGELLEQLTPRQREALATALSGLYKSAGVDLVEQEILRQLPASAEWYDLSPGQLLLWPEGFAQTTIHYGLDPEQATAPPLVEGPAPAEIPSLDVSRLLFRQIPLPWPVWVEAWEALTWPPLPDGLPALPDDLAPTEPIAQVLPS